MSRIRFTRGGAAMATWFAIVSGKPLPQVWPIPLVVGTILNMVNLVPNAGSGLKASVVVAFVVNYLMPYIVSSLGYLRCQNAILRPRAGRG